MDALIPSTTPARMVPYVAAGPVEHVGADELLAAAQELVFRLTRMATDSALPGDESVQWHEHRQEAMDVVSGIAVGLLTMAVPE